MLYNVHPRKSKRLDHSILQETIWLYVCLNLKDKFHIDKREPRKKNTTQVVGSH